MLASLIEAPLDDADFVYEPKYDGIRAIVEVAPRGAVHLWSRLGNEKTSQFPEVTKALQAWSRRLEAPVVLDGEIVALDADGNPTGFQQLQGRIHLTTEPDRSSRPRIAFIAFDLLRNGSRDLRSRPLTERRAELERVFSKTGSPVLRISDIVRADGRALYQEALDNGWEGLIAKEAASVYKSGKRTPDWRKVKIVHEQEFVVGGWTEPRASREYFGALLLGVYPESSSEKLIYAGHTGTGFNEPELARVMKRLRPLETTECPFLTRPKTNERPHWVKPALVAQVKFTEWTADDKLRHPVYLGLRDDKRPEDVHREESGRLRARASRPPTRSRSKSVGSGFSRIGPPSTSLLEELRTLEDARRNGSFALPGGASLTVTNLHKLFWPKLKLTKGDLMRYYVEVAGALLPAVDRRPLVMKRYPNGIASKPFYQHRAPDTVPDGVRVEKVKDDEVPSRIIGGSLTTLLYMAQLAAISMDPWFSRVDTPDAADYVALDLDPSPGVSFGRVLEVARWIHDELEWLGAAGVPKTSGSEGLHIYIPLPPDTPYDAGLLFCQIIATVVAQKHPKAATVERAVRARGARVYIDYLQNIRGKTLATAYSARASDYAGASTPLSWREVHDGVRREDFTIRTLPTRLKAVGDLWKPLRESKGVDLSRVSRYSRK